MRPTRLDHVALWTTDRDGVAARLEELLGFHEIERSDRFTLLGDDARAGKLTLFAAQGPRRPGPLLEIGLRVGGPAAATVVELDDGLRLRIVPAAAGPVDLERVALLAEDPVAARARWIELGFEPAPDTADGVPRVRVGDAFLELHHGEPGRPELPLLNHLGVLVDGLDEVRAAGSRPELGEVELVDAPNTLAAFVTGPDGVRLEYVAHKPTFSLA